MVVHKSSVRRGLDSRSGHLVFSSICFVVIPSEDKSEFLSLMMRENTANWAPSLDFRLLFAGAEAKFGNGLLFTI